MKKTIHIKDINGNYIDITERLGSLQPVTGANELFARLFNSDGIALGIEGFKDFKIPLAVKRPAKELTMNGGEEFISPSYDQLATKMMTSKSFGDSVIIDNWDNILLGVQEKLAAQKTANFLNSLIINSTKIAAADALNSALAFKIFINDTDYSKTKAQTAQVGKTTASAITAINSGTRVVTATDLATKNNALELVRRTLIKLETLGTREIYPFSWNGEKDIIILATSSGIRALAGDGFTRVINNGEEPKPNSIVATVDTVPVYKCNLLPNNVEFMVLTKRSLFYLSETIDPSIIIGEVINANIVKLADGTTRNLFPSEKLMQFQKSFFAGTKYDGEIFAIKSDGNLFF